MVGMIGPVYCRVSYDSTWNLLDTFLSELFEKSFTVRNVLAEACHGTRIGSCVPYGDWSKFPIIRGPIFGFLLKYGALYKFPPFWEQ